MGLLPDIGGAAASFRAAKQNRKATRKATEAQLAFLADERDRQTQLGQEASGLIGLATDDAAGELRSLGALSRNTLRDSTGDAARLQRQGFGEQLNTLQGFTDQARSDLQTGFSDARSALASLADPIEADAGFQFRQQQGEDAIRRAAAASGGLNSGRTLQSLVDFNQGLASQEAQNVFNRRLASADRTGALATGQGSTLANLAVGQGNTEIGLEGSLFGGLASNRLGLGQAVATQQAQQGSQLASLLQGGAAGQANALQNLAAQQAHITQQQLPLFLQPAQNAGLQNFAFAQGIGGDLNELTGILGNVAGKAVTAKTGGIL